MTNGSSIGIDVGTRSFIAAYLDEKGISQILPGSAPLADTPSLKNSSSESDQWLERFKTILSQAQDFFNQPVSSAVLSFPFCFEKFQIDLLKKSAQAAGLTSVKMIPNAVAAALVHLKQLNLAGTIGVY